MTSKYFIEDDEILKLELKTLQNKAKKLILNDYYDHSLFMEHWLIRKNFKRYRK